MVRHDHDRPSLQAGCHQLQSFMEGGRTGKAENVSGQAPVIDIAGATPDDLGCDVLRVRAAALRPTCHGWRAGANTVEPSRCGPASSPYPGSVCSLLQRHQDASVIE
jgi:hypothetical protein